MIFGIENPIEFSSEKAVGNYKVSYRNLREIAQGSPLVGNLYINERCFSENLLFGGPFLFCFESITIPLFVRKFCVAGFRLCKINLNTFEYDLYGKVKSLIFLDSIKNNEVTYFLDLNRAKSESLIINK